MFAFLQIVLSTCKGGMSQQHALCGNAKTTSAMETQSPGKALCLGVHISRWGTLGLSAFGAKFAIGLGHWELCACQGSTQKVISNRGGVFPWVVCQNYCVGLL